MSYTNVYPSRINWENEPSIVSPINATNLNKMDYALYEMDGTLDNWDTTKANQSDLLLCVKSIDYDDETGEFVFTWQNGTTKTVDLNIEKIPVSFSMDANGVITMTTDDGTTYTADVGSLIKTYTFTDSTEIDFTVTTDASGNKTVTAALVAGSITGDKLEPNYLANCQSAANSASGSATAADGSAEDSEAWAVGERDGVPVPSTDPAYQNNSKWWANHTSNSLAGLTDVNITTPTDGEVLKYDGANSEWVNGQAAAGGGSTVVVTTSESSLYGQSVTLSDGATTLTETFSNSGEATFSGVTLTGSVTISASSGGQTASKSLTMPYFGNYTAVLSFFTATITVTFDASKGATCTLDGVTASTSPHTFTVNSAGTYTASCTLDGVTKQGTAKVITTDGQAETDTIEYGTINLTYDDDFRGLSITCVNGGTTITKTAPSGGNTMVFYPPTTGTWTISGTVGGNPYTVDATVSSLSTPVSASLITVPDGTTITPTDDIQIWLACGQISGKSYTTLAEVLADTETYTRLLSDSNACDYMARSTTWASTLCADAQGMFQLGKYDYACDALLADSTWASAICNSPYFESVLDVKVPTMTSNTTPSGVCSSSSNRSGYSAYYAFVGSGNSWISNGTATGWVKYEFPSAVVAKVVQFTVPSDGGNQAKTLTVEGSNDDSTYTPLYEQTTDTTAGTTYTIPIPTNTTADKYYRWSILTSNSTYGAGLKNANVYGRHEAHAGKVIHTAYGNETVYYMNGGSPVTVCTATNGVGTFNLPAGTYTLYSTTAKDPDNLTDDYSKTVTITNNTTDIYLMPDNALYWLGYESNILEDVTSANGWSSSGVTFSSPTRNTTSMRLTGTSGTAQGVTSKYTVPTTANVSKVVCICQGVTALGDGSYGAVSWQKAKDFSGGNSGIVDVTSSSLAKVECTVTDTGDRYPLPIAGWHPYGYDLDAFWYE